VWGGIGRRTRLAKTAVEAKKRLSTRHRASVRSPESEKQKRDLGCWGHPGAGEVIVGRGVRRRTVRSTVDGRRTPFAGLASSRGRRFWQESQRTRKEARSIKTQSRMQPNRRGRGRGCRKSTTELACTRPPDQTVKPALDGPRESMSAGGRSQRRTSQETGRKKKNRERRARRPA
jgi:hypothetical protein